VPTGKLKPGGPSILNAYLKSQQWEEAKFLRLEDLVRKLAGSER